MLITYRRTGGWLALLGLAAVLTATVVAAIAVGVIVVIAAVVIGAVVLLARVVLPRSWRRRRVPPQTPWPQETIEATIVNPRDFPDERDLRRTDSDKG